MPCIGGGVQSPVNRARFYAVSMRSNCAVWLRCKAKARQCVRKPAVGSASVRRRSMAAVARRLLIVCGWISATLDAIRTELGDGGLIRRWRRGGEAPDEGAFLACSCWMADCLYLRCDEDAACRQFERVLAVANDLGLPAEEYDVRARCLMGNFPQALTHMAVVKTALLLSGTAKRHRSAAAH